VLPAAAGAHYGPHGTVQGLALEAPGEDLDFAASVEPFDDGPADAADPATERLASADWRSYPTADGAQLRIATAPEYEGTEVPLQVAGLIGSLVHGAELSRLSVLITTPSGADSPCSAGQPACYMPADELMVIPGAQPDNAMPLEMMIAHEYGHHVAANRDNDPWAASFWGTKRWATVEGVCADVAAGTAFPGGGGEQYWSNPGEAFAQAYAFMHYPGEVPWWWHIAEPDEAAYAAIRADVEQPWAPTWSGASGRLSKQRRSVSFAQDLPLDGSFEATLRGPRDAKYDLILRAADGSVIDRTRGDGAKDVLKAQICGVRAATLEVVRKDGDGRFRVGIHGP
jgi:hypothetical protein